MLMMSDFVIEDWEFDLVQQDWGATKHDVQSFIKELADEFNTTWSRESDCWVLHNIDDDAYIDLQNSLEDRIEVMDISESW